MQYDGRPDGCFGVRVWMWNLGSLRGKGGEACEELRRIIDAFCLQVRLRGQGAWMKRIRCNLWLSGKGDGIGGVVVMVKEELC